MMLRLLAQVDADKALNQGKSWFYMAKIWCTDHWYVSIPGAFVACFLVAWFWARHQWNRT